MASGARIEGALIVTVYSTPGLYALEIWRGIAGGVPLSHFQGRKAEYFLALREFLLQLYEGAASVEGERETRNLMQAAGFERLVLCGGGALDPSLGAVLRSEELPFAVEIDAAGPYAAKRGALRIFDAMGWRRGLALDLGQTQLKVMTAARDAVLTRDTSSGLRELITDGISRVIGQNGGDGDPPDGVVLALPASLGSDGVARSANCPDLCGPVQTTFSGLFACPCVVLNDAVLAAVGFPPLAGEKTLVLTLGFGLGSALWAK